MNCWLVCHFHQPVFNLLFSFGAGQNIWKTAQGDREGQPVAQTGWRASCMYGWNTTEGGPCFLRPTGARSWDSPNPDKIIFDKCVVSCSNIEVAVSLLDLVLYSTQTNVTATGECEIDTSHPECAAAWCDANQVEHDVDYDGALAEVVGSWNPDVTDGQVTTLLCYCACIFKMTMSLKSAIYVKNLSVSFRFT